MEEVASESNDRIANNTDAVRHNYRVLSDAEKAAMVDIKDIGAAFIEKVNMLSATEVSEGRCASIAVTKIEEAVMWAVKGITA